MGEVVTCIFSHGMRVCINGRSIDLHWDDEHDRVELHQRLSRQLGCRDEAYSIELLRVFLSHINFHSIFKSWECSIVRSSWTITIRNNSNDIFSSYRKIVGCVNKNTKVQIFFEYSWRKRSSSLNRTTKEVRLITFKCKFIETWRDRLI